MQHRSIGTTTARRPVSIGPYWGAVATGQVHVFRGAGRGVGLSLLARGRNTRTPQHEGDGKRVVKRDGSARQVRVRGTTVHPSQPSLRTLVGLYSLGLRVGSRLAG